MGNSKLNILVLIPFFYPHRGGSQKYTEDLYSKLCALHTNVTVDVLCYNTDNALPFETYRGLNVYRIPCYSIIPGRFVLPKLIPLLKHLYSIRNNHYSIVNPHITFFDVTWWGWLYAKLIKAKSVFTSHNASHASHQNKIVAAIARLVDLTIVRMVIKRYDYITVENKAAGEFLQEKYDVSHYSVVYGAVDMGLFDPITDRKNRQVPKINLLIDEKTIVVTYLGRLIWTKGVTYLFDAAQELLSNYPQDNLLFVFAGPGEMEKELLERAKKQGLHDHIKIIGNIPYNMVSQLLKVTDIFVNPSHHNEGLPIAILEAAASGNCIIATDNGGVKEIVKNNETGLLIPQRNVKAIVDGIHKLASNNETRTRYVSSMLSLVRKQHNLNTVAKSYYELIINLTNNTAPAI